MDFPRACFCGRSGVPHGLRDHYQKASDQVLAALKGAATAAIRIEAPLITSIQLASVGYVALAEGSKLRSFQGYNRNGVAIVIDKLNLERGSGGRGRREKSTSVAEHDLGVRAHVDDQGHSLGLVGLLRQHDPGRVRADGVLPRVDAWTDPTRARPGSRRCGSGRTCGGWRWRC